MKQHNTLSDLGERALIKIIENIIYESTGKELIQDDSFFYALPPNINENVMAVFNSDMLVSTTDIPNQMTCYQMGWKAVIMNISDLIVKNVKPRAIIISLGLPRDLRIDHFEKIIKGIVDCSIKYDVDYIGGDLNETKEIIINPTVYGYQEKSRIIFRKGAREGEMLVANGQFGLTGVGFDILLNKKGNLMQFPSYQKSIMSVLEPGDFKGEAFILGGGDLVSASIDSSDGLLKSLTELISSNSNIGFEIFFNEELIDKEAMQYSKEFHVSLKNLVLNAGEEFIHLFTISQEDFHKASEKMREKDMKLYQIGRVISEEKIYLLENNQKVEIKTNGFQHFNQ